MLDLRLIIDLVTVLMAAALGGLLSARLKLPVLLGYILGGMVVGPKGLGLIKEIVQVETLAQLGAAFLLFGLGVEFSLAELRKVQTIALGGGTLQILITVGITTVVSLLIGWVATPVQGIFLGCILSLSSTAVVLRSLAERNEMETVHGQVSLGILIVQDIALGLMLAVLPALDSPQAVGQAVLRALLVTALFAGAAIAFGRWCIPSLLRWVASTESKELFLLFKAVPVILQGCQRVPPLSRWLDREQLPQAIAVSASQTNHLIVCGYGKVGQNIVSLLLARHYPTVVIEQSEAKVQLLRDRGIPYVYGNCASAHVLEAAGIRQARSLVLVVSDPIASKLCLREALKLAPQLDVVARACQDSDIDLLYQLGAKEVVHPEFEASLELSTHLLLVLGESPQTVEREVRTVRQSRYADFRPDIACPLPELILSSPE